MDTTHIKKRLSEAYDLIQAFSPEFIDALDGAAFSRVCMVVICHAAIVEEDRGAAAWLLGRPGVTRSSPEASAWRVQVFERDNYTCRDCGARGRLHAHHIESWAMAPALRLDIANGLTLCPDCHAKRHVGLENLIKAARYHGTPV